ncbi:hypothetical protein V1264_023137 [Littorina saxatilis]|uniref:39S ribosomal protein L55, mitochondrial n=1 Tax=Littorina saxatilis TaxID=31220 RepID=A0AAN9G922_9CAEN
MSAALLLRQGLIREGLCSRCCAALTWQSQRDNSNKTSICRLNRRHFPRQYPTMLVQPDGSTINVRYVEPRKIIKLPVDLSTLSEAERKVRLQQRKPKQKLVIEDDLEEESFDVSQYSHLWKK